MSGGAEPGRVMFSTAEDGFESATRELREAFGRSLRVERIGSDVGVLVTPSPSVSEVAAACFSHPIAFVRHLTVERRRIASGVAGDRAAVASAAVDLVVDGVAGAEVAVQAWASGSPRIGYSSGELFHAIADALSEREFTATRAGQKHVLSACVTSEGVSLGLNTAAESLVDWPGGRLRLARDENRVSRAEFKLEELFQVFPTHLPRGGRAIDLGAAPGGWTRVLRGHGLTVWAVDPGEMDPSVLADRGVHHARTTAGEFFRATDMLFDVAVNDMRMDPQMSCRVMVEAAGRLRAGGIAIVTLKTGSRQPVDTLHRCLALLGRQYRVLFARQLQHNRHEVTVVCRRVAS